MGTPRHNLALVCGVLLILLAGLGRVGYTTEGVMADIPAPPSADRVTFGPDPLPEHPAPALFDAEATVTWDRDDVWVAVVDQAEYDRCQDAPASALFGICTSNDLNALAMGAPENREEGMTWTIPEGVHWAGYGTVGTPSGSTLDLQWSVHVKLDGAPTALLLLFGAGLLAYGRPRPGHSTPS